MHTKVFEVLSQTSVKGIPLQVKTYEAENTREDAAKAHGVSLLVAYPQQGGRECLIIGLRRREDLESWAEGVAMEALERAKRDSQPRKMSMTFNQHSDWDKPLPPDQLQKDLESIDPKGRLQSGCFGCFVERVWAGDETHRPSLTAKDHSCGK